jgi:GAF domain-containing protein
MRMRKRLDPPLLATLQVVPDVRMGAEVSEVVQRPSRLRALAELGANPETSAEALDRIGQVACRVLGVPVALVNLIGADRQRFVGCSGPEPWASMRDMPLTAGFCPFALGVDDAYALEDARVDPALATNPAVEQLGVVAYAGVPLRAAGGEPIGTLCAIDYEPRSWSQDDLALLTDLAAGVIAELQLLTASRLVARQQVRMRALTVLSSALAPADSVRDVLDEVCRTVDRFDTHSVWLSIVDESGEKLRTAAASGADPEAAALHPDVPLAATLAPAEVVRTGEPDFMTTRADVRDRFAELLEAMPDIGSVAMLPLTAGEERLGVLAISFADERAFSAADREYLAALGGISALTLARDRRARGSA